MLSHPSMIASVLERAGPGCPASVLQPVAPQPLPGPLEDEQLRAEIELLLDVIVAVADNPDHLSPQQVDAALQLPLPWPAAS